MLVFNFSVLNSQTVDPYIDHTGQTFNSQLINSYDGEFFIFYPNKTTVQNNQVLVTYDIETVSFPFTPPNFKTTGDANPNSSARELYLPDVSNYKRVENFSENQNRDGYVWDDGIFHKADLMKFRLTNGDSYQMGLTSNSFMWNTGVNFEENSRIYFPNTILKIKLNYHGGPSKNDNIIYSNSYIVDFTRGRFKFYPWRATNTSANDLGAYDFIFHPKIKNMTNHYYNTSSNNGLIHPNNNGTINYYPAINIDDVNGIAIYPDPLNINSPNAVFSGYDALFLYPAPYCLPDFEIRDQCGDAYAGYNPDGTINPGLEHTYHIDKAMDLTIINPVEKIIYNPSEAYIDINDNNDPLIFPEGYTFKTINGLFPTRNAVENKDPYNLHRDIRDVNVSNTTFPNQANQHTSEYIVDSASILIIEPCVTLIDVDIRVKNGGTVKYDASRVYLNNSNIVVYSSSDQGTIISNYNYNGQVYEGCNNDCYDITYYNKYNNNYDNIEITQNTTWDDNSIDIYFQPPSNMLYPNAIMIPGNIIVKSGATLTIEDGLNFMFSESSKIIVEKGAKLIVNGQSGSEVTFTSACDRLMWEGIEVWGNETIGQYANPRSETSQGYLELNYVNVSNALTGVLLGERDNLIQIEDKTKAGGLVIADNTNFENNGTSVEFFHYQEYLNNNNIKLPNYSKFSNCNFTVNSKLNDEYFERNDQVKSQVIIDKNRYVTFDACNFYNDKTINEPAKRGIAIYAKEASLRIKNEEITEFEGFTEAILVENTAPDGNTVYINNCVFTDNVHSIVLDAVDNVRLYNNDINVPNSEENNYISSSDQLERGYDNPVGIYIRKSIMNDIRKNVIDGGNPATSIPNSYGIIINNCGGSANQTKHSSKEHFSRAKTNIGFGRIYKNTIENLSRGIQAEYNNGGDDNGINSNNPSSFLVNNGTGEEIKCNTFDNNVLNDIYLTGSSYELYGFGTQHITSELRHQGICLGSTGPASNTFSTSPTTNLNLNYSGDQTSRVFFYRKFNNETAPTYNTDLTIENCNLISTNENTCEDISPCLGVGLPCLLDNIAEIRSDIILIKQNISNTIDNGNTNELISIIEDGNDNDIYNALLDASPFLSDDVLLKLINKSPIINETYFEEIIIVNCGLSDTVITALENYELSSEVRENINESITTRSARTQLYEELEYLKYELNIAQLELINYAIDNLDEQVYSDVLNSFDNNSLSELYKKYSWALYYGNYTDVENALNLISVIEENEGLNSNINNIAQLNFEKETSESFYLSLNQINELKENISKDTVSSIAERVFLKHYLGENYPRIPVQQNIEYLSAKQEYRTNNQELNKLFIYPNPASDNITVKLNIISSGKIEIRNMLGDLIIEKNLFNNNWSNINTSSINSGVYIVVFKETGTNKVFSNKLIIR